MGNCFSEVTAGRAAIGGTAGDFRSLAGAPNDAVELFLRSRGHHGLFSQIEVLSFASCRVSQRVLFTLSSFHSPSVMKEILHYNYLLLCFSCRFPLLAWVIVMCFSRFVPSVKRFVNLNLLHRILPI